MGDSHYEHTNSCHRKSTPPERMWATRSVPLQTIFNTKLKEPELVTHPQACSALDDGFTHPPLPCSESVQPVKVRVKAGHYDS